MRMGSVVCDLRVHRAAVALLLVPLVGCSKPDASSKPPAPAPSASASVSSAPSAAASPAVAPCPAAPALPPPNLPPLAKGVEIRIIEVDRTGHGQHPIIDGETNLPDGTGIVLMVRQVGDFKDRPWFGPDEAPQIRGGRFRACTSDPLPDGDYRVEVLVQKPDAQPAALRETIAGLRGKLVRRDDDGKTTVEAISDVFVVGDDKAAAVAAALAERTRRRDVLRGALRALREQLAAGKQKRRGLDPECIADMRARHEAIDEARKPVEALPAGTPGRLHLLAASGFARGCVACVDRLVEQCTQGENNLREGEKEIAGAKLK